MSEKDKKGKKGGKIRRVKKEEKDCKKEEGENRIIAWVAEFSLWGIAGLE